MNNSVFNYVEKVETRIIPLFINFVFKGKGDKGDYLYKETQEFSGFVCLFVCLFLL